MGILEPHSVRDETTESSDVDIIMKTKIPVSFQFHKYLNCETANAVTIWK
jgi:predicted nucleotidyltransferase